ncbi:hypothetical protein DFJ73DRAFT_962885 [Zopfochytrium polystomum]|nr:hypothetical protein DFJ73DRAFT_962885 [Zopfochytrium polystomum]
MKKTKGAAAPHPPLVASEVLRFLDGHDRLRLATLYRLKHRQAEALVRIYDRDFDDKDSDDARCNKHQRDVGFVRLGTVLDDDGRRCCFLSAPPSAPYIDANASAAAAGAAALTHWSSALRSNANRATPIRRRRRPDSRRTPRCAIEAASARSDPAMLDFLLTHGHGYLANIGCAWVGGSRPLSLGKRWRSRWDAPVHADRQPPLFVASGCGLVDVLARWAASEEEHSVPRDGEIAAGGLAYAVAAAVTWENRTPASPMDEARGRQEVVERAMKRAAAAGHVAVLQWWWDAWIAPASRSVEGSVVVGRAEWGVDVDDASANGHLAALRWLRDRGFSLIRSVRAVDAASANGHADVVAWWLRDSAGEGKPDGGDGPTGRESVSPPPRLSYTVNALDKASAGGHVSVLQLWRDSGLPMQYTGSAMNDASENGHVPVLQWWKDTGLALSFTAAAISRACENGHVAVLQWWRDSGLDITFRDDLVDRASTHGQVAVLQWLKESEMRCPYTCRAMDYASARGHVAVLQWWKDSGGELLYTEDALRYAVDRRELGVLQWWLDSGLSLLYSSQTVKAALGAGLLSVLYQWHERVRQEVRPHVVENCSRDDANGVTSLEGGTEANNSARGAATIDAHQIPQNHAELVSALDNLGAWATVKSPPSPISPCFHELLGPDHSASVCKEQGAELNKTAILTNYPGSHMVQQAIALSDGGGKIAGSLSPRFWGWFFIGPYLVPVKGILHGVLSIMGVVFAVT